MKKPTLKDFNLSEDDITEYHKQCERHQKAVRAAFEEIKQKKKTALIALAAISAIIGIILAISLPEYWLIWLIAPFCFTCIPMLILFQTMDSGSLSKSKSEELDLLIDYKLKMKYDAYKEKVYEYEQYIEKCKRDFWINLNGYQFEREVAELYRKIGYQAEVTPKSGDGGVDIILKSADERIAVQCKHHKNKVGPNDIRALQGVVHNGNYTSGIFVSLNGFTPTVPNEVRLGKERIMLITLDDLLIIQEETA